MAHWHSHNDWASRVVYVPSISEVMGQDYEDRVLAQYKHVDAYILPGNPGHRHHFGIHYGAAPDKYISCNVLDDDKQELLSRLIRKYGGEYYAQDQ